MKPGRIDRFLNVHTIIHHAHQDVGDRGDNSRPARRAQDQKEFAVFEHDGGRHGGEWALSGPDRVGGTLNQPVDIRDTLLHGEIVHLIVEQKS